MKPLTKYVIVFLIFICARMNFAQINVQTTISNRNLEIFFISGIDRNSGEGLPELFRVTITVGTLSPPTPPPHSVQLTVEMIKDGQDVLYRGQSGTFQITSNQPPLIISSKQIFSLSGPYHLEDGSLEDAGKDLLKDILSTSKLPSGRYTFRVSIMDHTASVNVIPGEDDIFISNPGKLDLIFPGRAATGNREDCQEIFTNLPQFRWESDMKRFRVIIAEARPGEDPESALNQTPRFTRLFIIQSGGNLGVLPDDFGFSDPVDVLPSTSFQYPSSGEVLTFRPGRTYYWRVVGIVESSSGPITLNSEIFCFRIARLDQLGSGHSQIEFILRSLLGSDYERLFGQGGEFEGYLAKRLYLNGKEITPAELVSKMQKLQGRYSGYRVEK